MDKFAACEPDEIVDLERFPWPWPTSSAEEVLLSHVLEHLGASADVYIGVMKELWRVCRDGAQVTIIVPHPRHDDFLSDPTHVRPVTELGLELFSRKANEYCQREGFANTPLALFHGIDFDLVSTQSLLDEPWAGDFKAGRIDEQAVEQAAARYNNVIKQQSFVLRAVK